DRRSSDKGDPMKPRHVAALMLPLLVLLMSTPAVFARDPFAGKWDATISPEGGGKDMKGFASQQYEEDTRGAGAISATWKCEQKSTKPAEGKAEWTGTVTASDMS